MRRRHAILLVIALLMPNCAAMHARSLNVPAASPPKPSRRYLDLDDIPPDVDACTRRMNGKLSCIDVQDLIRLLQHMGAS